MDQKNNEQTMQLQLDIKPEVARGIYANLVLINHSHSDFVIDFAQALPGMPKPEVASRMIMAPEHAKRLLMALQENVLKYEQAFGRIDLGTAEDQRMIPPIAPTSGETNDITAGAIPFPLPIPSAASKINGHTRLSHPHPPLHHLRRQRGNGHIHRSHPHPLSQHLHHQ